MSKRYWFALLLVMTMGLALIIGCSDSGDKVVAKVGDYKINTTEFADFTGHLTRPLASAQAEFDERRNILDSLIVNRLLIQAAYEKNIDDLEEISRVVLANKDKFLLDVLYQREVTDRADATEAETKDFYNKLEYKIRASHIVVSSEDTAKALLERIMAGENFEQLAYDYSEDPSAKRNRGDLGFFTYGAMVDEFQDVAFAMEAGEVSPPVKTEFGYHIIKLIDKQPNDVREDYKVMKDQLQDQLTDRKRGQLTLDFMKRLQAKYAVTVDSATVQYIMHKREELYPPQLLEKLPRSDFDVEQLDRNEKELVLATWNGGQITLLEYLTQARQIGAQYRPDLDDTDSLATIIFRLKTRDFLVLEANQLGLETDPEFKRKMSLFKELSMASIMRDDSLPRPLDPDEAEIRQYYEEHKDEFADPAEIHIYEILLSDEILAAKLAKEIKTLAEFKQKAMDLTERPAKRGTNGDLGYIQRQWFPEIFDLAKKTPDGTIGGPVLNAGTRYSIFWVVDKVEPRVKDYLDVKPQIGGTLFREAKKEALRKWIEERKEATNIVINDDVIWETINMDKYPEPETDPEAQG